MKLAPLAFYLIRPQLTEGVKRHDTYLGPHRMLLPTLIEALNDVDKRYYGRLDYKRIALRGCDVHDENPDQLPIMNELFKHNERTFCYELYRHWANHLENRRSSPSANSPAILQCELPKDLVRKIARQFPGVRALSSRFVPDFLVHKPGSFDHQELVMEVKANPSLCFADMLSDLRKLNQFMERYLYQQAVFLAINVSSEQLVGLVTNARQRASLRRLRRGSNITILTRQSADHETMSMSVAELSQVPPNTR
jgi:hypothetical protein